MSSETGVDEIFAGLTEIQRRLDALPVDALQERADLAERRAELQLRARVVALDAVTDSEIESKLRRLRKEFDKRMQGRLGHSAAGQTGLGGGIDPKHVHELNRRMDEATDVASLRAEIAHLEQRLAARTAEEDERRHRD